MIFNSLQHGYLATLDLDFALSLRNDVALSLYRLLSKKKYGGRATYEMELKEFYHRHLGLRPTPFASKMKERLQNGHQKLIERGFLEAVRYLPMKTENAESDAEIEQFFASLEAGEQERIATETQTRLESAHLGHLAPEHAARLSVRRNVIRDWIQKGQTDRCR